jgi:tetratricopeptide (TPR) repeat protein
MMMIYYNLLFLQKKSKPLSIKYLKNMRKFSILFFVLFAVSFVNAQKAKRTDAFNYLRNGKLDKAKENIEPCITNEATMMDPKTWFYRGNIFLQIHMNTKPEYKNLDSNALEIAYDSYKKALDLDTKQEYKTQIYLNLATIGNQLYNKGITLYQTDKYSDAQKLFERVISVNKTFGNVDTLCIYLSGICAQLTNNYDQAIDYFTQLKNLKYNRAEIYSSLSDIYRLKKDFNNAQVVIKEGLSLYPTSPIIWYAQGCYYDNMGNINEALNSYKKSIELKPDFFDSYYNIGALYYNKAASIIDSANKLPFEETKKYEEMKLSANNNFQEALPYLEKAHEITPQDLSTLISLKEIYTRLNITDKLKVINEQIDQIKK